MATHSSFLAWKAPRTEQPGGPLHGITNMTEVTEHSRTHPALQVSLLPLSHLGNLWSTQVGVLSEISTTLQIIIKKIGIKMNKKYYEKQTH